MNGSTIVYVTREIERALGMAPSATYRIVTNRTSYGESIERQYPRFVTLLDARPGDNPDASGLLGTGDLIARPETAELMAAIAEETGARPYVMVFKNTARIEPLIRDRGWLLLNPPAAASEKVENKVSQIAWLGELERYLPRHRIETTKNVRWSGAPFVIQWAHGHTGGGTLLISSEADLARVAEKFPERRARVTEFLSGPSFTLNVVATPDRVILSTVSYQITGLRPFTDSPFATVGNDWAVARKILTAADRATIDEIAAALGAKMQQSFWRGLFGIDLMRDDRTGEMRLIELNARQPASTTFESALQAAKRGAGAKGLTTFEAHIGALLGRAISEPLIPVDDGAQIVQRVTGEVRSVGDDAAGSLELAGFTAIRYDNAEANADLLRVQSSAGIMAGHNELGPVGKRVLDCLV